MPAPAHVPGVCWGLGEALPPGVLVAGGGLGAQELCLVVPPTSMDGCVSLGGKKGRDLLENPNSPMLAKPFEEAWDEV